MKKAEHARTDSGKKRDPCRWTALAEGLQREDFLWIKEINNQISEAFLLRRKAGGRPAGREETEVRTVIA